MPNKRKAKDCEICGVNFRPSYPAQRTCGRECGWQLRVREGKVSRPIAKQLELPQVRDCQHCSAGFVPTAGRRYCSDECVRAVKRIADLLAIGSSPEIVDACRRCGVRLTVPRRRSCDACLRLAGQQQRRRDKARRRGVKHEPYTLAEIAERDGYRCGLCLEAVDMTLVVPHLEAPTIDHVLPIVRGGDDTRANVQLAHFICNSRKSDGRAELALAGIGS